MASSTPNRVQAADLAKTLGLHASTISRALRGRPGVSEPVRQRVLAEAERQGYRPDPFLSALARYRFRDAAPMFAGALAWVTNFPERTGWRARDYIMRYHAGAKAATAQRGFSLEEFWLAEPGVTPRRASQILESRGVAGLLLAPQPGPGMSLDLDWRKFSAVTLGYSLAAPHLHVTTNHQHRTTLTALRELARLGYRRIGFVADSRTLRRAEHMFDAAYRVYEHVLAPRERIPLLVFDSGAGREAQRRVFARWLARHKPDAVLSGAALLGGWLRELGCDFPREIGYARLSRDEGPEIACIDQCDDVIGARAAELLMSNVIAGERGVPSLPSLLLVDGRWQPAGSVRKVGPPADDILERLQ